MGIKDGRGGEQRSQKPPTDTEANVLTPLKWKKTFCASSRGNGPQPPPVSHTVKNHPYGGHALLL